MTAAVRDGQGVHRHGCKTPSLLGRGDGIAGSNPSSEVGRGMHGSGDSSSGRGGGGGR